jgi:hypothetical protein
MELINQHNYTVELRIFGVEPASITRDLGLQPCQTRTAGVERLRGRVDSEDMWAYNGTDNEGVSWESLEEGLDFVMGKLWSNRETLATYSRAGARLIWWCGHFSCSFDGGPSLSPTLLRKLGEFGAELFIDNYLSSSH